jgi:hypothetical protein
LFWKGSFASLLGAQSVDVEIEILSHGAAPPECNGMSSMSQRLDLHASAGHRRMLKKQDRRFSKAQSPLAADCQRFQPS